MKAAGDQTMILERFAACRSTPLIYAVAHAGRGFPHAHRAQLQANMATLRSLEDPLVDQLTDGAGALGIERLVNRTARAFVDVNRDPADIDPQLVEDGRGRETPRTRAGLGVVPRLGGDGKALYRGRLDRAEIEGRIHEVHRLYHAELTAMMHETQTRWGRAVLIDWHSMPSLAAQAEQRRGGTRPDIVLGDRHGQSASSEIAGVVRAAFEARGRRVIMNRPFAGGYTTQLWGQPNASFHAVQVEIDRSLYLNEETLEPAPGLVRLQADIQAVGEALIAWLESKKAAPESAA